MVEKYHELKSVVKTAQHFGVGRVTVKRWLSAAQVKRYGPKTIDPNREQKFCSRCGEIKTIEEYWEARGRTDGRQAWCKPCSVAALRESNLKTKYGLTREQYDEILKTQGNGCAVCGSVDSNQKPYGGDGKSFELHVDHCHESGKVRGILCSSCNSGLGRFKDDPALLLNAINYLQRSE